MKRGDFVNIENGVGKVLSIGEETTKLSIAFKEKGQQVLKVVEVLNEALGEVIPPIAEFFEDVKQLFSRLPDKLEIDSKEYEMLLNTGPRKEADIVSYIRREFTNATWNNPLLAGEAMETRNIVHETYVLLEEKGATMYEAKRNMKATLRMHGLL